MNKKKPLRLFAGPMMSLLSIVILTPSLNGCDEATFKYICPTLKKYSAQFQNELADEVPRLPPRAKQVISDYGQLRDACRALEKK